MTEYSPDDYIKYRIDRAKETILEVRTHIVNGYWNTAINRMYYACYYAVSALLFKDGIEISSHSGVRQKFGEHFVKTGKFDRYLAKHFTELFEKRHKGDYNDFYDYDEETVLRLYPISLVFIEEIEKVLNNWSWIGAVCRIKKCRKGGEISTFTPTLRPKTPSLIHHSINTGVFFDDFISYFLIWSLETVFSVPEVTTTM